MDIWLVLQKKLVFYLSYSQNNSKTYFSELVTSTYPTQYIHVGDTVSLFCDLKVKTEDELESMKWFIGSDEVDDSNLLDNANFDTTNTLQKTTYTDPVPDKTEGGVYKCQYNFKVGDPISLETTVAVHCKYFFFRFCCEYFDFTSSFFCENLNLQFYILMNIYLLVHSFTNNNDLTTQNC